MIRWRQVGAYQDDANYNLEPILYQGIYETRLGGGFKGFETKSVNNSPLGRVRVKST